MSYAAANEFSTGKWAVPVTPEERVPRTPQTLTPEQVAEIALGSAEVKRVVALGAELGEPIFNPDYGVWEIYVIGMGSFLWIEDYEEGKIILNGIPLVDADRTAGYPIPPDEWLINYTLSEQ